MSSVLWGAYGLPLPRRHPIITLIGRPMPDAELLLPGCLGLSRDETLKNLELADKFA